LLTKITPSFFYRELPQSVIANWLLTGLSPRQGLDPIQAVNEACDHFLGRTYEARLVPILENVHAQKRRLTEAKKRKQISQGSQLELPLWNEGQAG